MTNKVEKGQKYKANGTSYEYTILTDPFEMPDGCTQLVYWDHTVDRAFLGEGSFPSVAYTLIREPEYKVGDRVVSYGETVEVVAASSLPDKDGEFWYVLNIEGAFECVRDRDITRKAAS